jgi:hypothetical protein
MLMAGLLPLKRAESQADWPLATMKPNPLLPSAKPDAQLVPNLEEVVNAWADEVIATAPERHHLDFAVHFQNSLPDLLRRLRNAR